MRTLTLFCSEIGNLIGRNRFKSQEEAIQEFLIRVAPLHANTQYVETKQLVETYVTKKKLDQKPIHLIEHENTVQQTKNDITIQALTATIETADLQQLTPQDVQNCLTAEKDKPIKSIQVQKRITDLETCQKIHKEKKQKVVIQEACKLAIKKIQCDAGIKGEQECIRANVIPETQKGFCRYIGHNVQVYGKVDGITTEYVIEIKTRQKRLWRRLWPQELTQVYAYMWITNRKKCKFIERKKDSSEQFEKFISWNETTWDTMKKDIFEVTHLIRKRIGES